MSIWLSVIVPVYNVRPYLAACMESILSQRCGVMEIVLVDDGSSDGSGALCDEFALAHPDAVSVIHQRNMGLSGARNTGIERCGGEYILFVDSDDTLAPGAFVAMRAAVTRYDAPDMVIFGGRTVWEGGAASKSSIGGTAQGCTVPPGQVTRLCDARELLLAFPAAWMRLTKRRIFLENGIRFPPGLWFEDIACTPLLLACCESIVRIEDICYNYLKREGSITTSSNAARRCADVIAGFDLLLGWFRAHGLYNAYRQELECMALAELLIVQAVMILLTGGADDRVSRLVCYMEEHFPHYMRNPYLFRIDQKQRIKLRLLSARQYGLLRLAFRVTGLRRRLRRKA